MCNKERLEEAKIKRLGEVRKNKQGTLMKIIEYKDCKNIVVEFQDEYKYKKSTNCSNFDKGSVGNPYDKTVCGIGYLGEGKYNYKNYPLIWKEWVRMIERCYDPYQINKFPTYAYCLVCEEWHCFQNFAKWYEENHYKCNEEIMELDKDILFKGNKIYSPETCCFVPKRINSLFVNKKSNRGEYLIGCDNNKGMIRVRCKTLDGIKYLGYFNLNKPFQAFLVYKNFKESYIKQVADEYKNLIPDKLYEAMYRYEVEIND